ncbi:ribonuclease III [[Mycoplasma] falconis]|uniref:Ribonuclease 3 n=1 Tax=[Mycoplasma] falconis TaxID=92403 RepID=A0A501XB66_9BACT|nr:ribonuclease III [[Mycoplasma] falconis]TPE57716.1 ribonuclease III [[Mycoplasma] falconis]
MNNWQEDLLIYLKENFDINNLNEDQKAIFFEAFTHKSYTNEHRSQKSYQYLEFLGDAVLQFMVGEEIYKQQQDFDEGQATLLRSKIVDRENLGRVSNELNLVDKIRCGKNAFLNGRNIKAQSDIFESFIGAVYISFGLSRVREIVDKYLTNDMKAILNDFVKDPKSRFQELIQSTSVSNIVYKDEAIANGMFESAVYVDDMKFGEGQGLTKKEAQKNAALAALEKMNLKGE